MTALADAPPRPAERAATPAPGAAAVLRILLWLFVGTLCVGPFLLVLAISFGEKIDGAAWVWGLTTASYERFLFGIGGWENPNWLYPQRLWFSLYYAVIASLIAVVFAFPFAWLLTRRSRRAQSAWLVFILASLALSEVFVVMGWDVLLSRNSGLPMVLRETGVTDWLRDNGWFPLLQEWDLANPRDVKFKTSTFATVLTMSYLVWPYAVILLYPALSRLDPSMMEAARTMGAPPLTVIRTVVLPSVRLPLVGATLLLFVYLLGAYVVVTVFAAPSRQTLTVTIFDAVRGATLDAPFGAAQSVVLLVAASLLLALSALAARKGQP